MMTFWPHTHQPCGPGFCASVSRSTICDKNRSDRVSPVRGRFPTAMRARQASGPLQGLIRSAWLARLAAASHALGHCGGHLAHQRRAPPFARASKRRRAQASDGSLRTRCRRRPARDRLPRPSCSRGTAAAAPSPPLSMQLSGCRSLHRASAAAAPFREESSARPLEQWRRGDRGTTRDGPSHLHSNQVGTDVDPARRRTQCRVRTQPLALRSTSRTGPQSLQRRDRPQRQHPARPGQGTQTSRAIMTRL
jgi:hypothetical protein